MLRTSHVTLGAFTALSLQHTPTVTTGLLLFGAVVGSLAPDWDLRLGLKHRGPTHWFIWPVLLFLFFGSHPLGLGLVLGWALHLLADLLTVEGLRLWPLRLRIRGPFRTGSFGEQALVVPVVLILVVRLFR